MIISYPEFQQDSIPGENIAVQDTALMKPVADTAIYTGKLQPKDSLPHHFLSQKKPVTVVSDTTSLCVRNSIADVTFYDTSNVAARAVQQGYDRFPILFTAKNRLIHDKAMVSLEKQLRPGKELPVRLIHDDWIIMIVILVAYLFSFLRSSSKISGSGIARFFILKGINETPSRDIGALFQWESTVKNLISFLIFGLFGYCAASYYGYMPSNISGFLFWLLAVTVVISAVTARHFVCIVTGSVSSENEMFREYLLGVYQFYRFGALSLFVIILLLSYTTLLTADAYFKMGIIVIGILYLMRILRLLVIFINRNISILYLILYLCALEILPILISVKYISGLV
jgi:Domain of unknown function (DUF4271)